MNNNDLISRAAAIKEIEDLMQYYRQIGAECDRDGALFARERIKKLPAVDAVPAVRCSECKFGKLCLDADGHRLIQCTNTKYPTANVETWPLELDWYCAGGERRDGDT